MKTIAWHFSNDNFSRIIFLKFVTTTRNLLNVTIWNYYKEELAKMVSAIADACGNCYYLEFTRHIV